MEERLWFLKNKWFRLFIYFNAFLCALMGAFFLLGRVSCLTVHAAETDSMWNDYYNAKVDSWKSKYPYYCVYDWNSVYTVIFSSSPMLSPKDHSGLLSSSVTELANVQVSKATMKDSGSPVIKTVSSGSLYSCGLSTSNFVFTNYDIWEVGADKSKDQPVFRGPERPLVAAVRGASPEEALKEVILLIPLSILFLVGCLGLRKGLRLLLTLLRRA